MTLCDICQHKSYFFGASGAFYCSERAKESFVPCNGWTDFVGFNPVDGLNYSRAEIIAKWRRHIEKLAVGG